MTKEELNKVVELHTKLEDLKSKISKVEFRIKTLDAHRIDTLIQIELPRNCALVGLNMYLSKLKAKLSEGEKSLKEL